LGTNQQKRILVAPLDWGLGHTARCVPIIRYLQGLGHLPVVACNSWQRTFIEETFGNIEIIHLDGYNITYSPRNKWLQMGLIAQLPHINKIIHSEHRWVMEKADKLGIDFIISDNRYGLFHPTIPSVIMTHQLMVQGGAGIFIDRAIQKIHYKYLNRFKATWVVDTAGSDNLAGKLSHPSLLPRKSQYIGLLSRFSNDQRENNPKDNVNNLLVLLSGPEPQRSILSEMLWKQVCSYDGNITFVEGSTDTREPAHIPRNITYYKRLTDKALVPLLKDADMVICRSGYSTLMDLALLRKPAVIIPTPGQTEQEYLGRHMHERGIFYCCNQKGFDLTGSIRKALRFTFNFAIQPNDYHLYQDAVDELITARAGDNATKQ
jgi:hypothetical protein